MAFNYAINKILSLNLKTINEVHRELYRDLREWFGLPPRIAFYCYGDALANVKAWGRHPYKGRRLTTLLHQGSGLGSSAGIGDMTNMRIERQGMRIERQGSYIEVGR